MDVFSDMEITYFTLTMCNSTHPLEPTTLPYIDLTCLLSGEMIYYYNNEKVLLRGGDAILFPKGSVRSRLSTNTPVQYASFNMIVPDDFQYEVTGHLKNFQISIVSTILDLFLIEWNSTTEYAARQQLTLFKYLYTHIVESVENSQNPYVIEIKKYIYQNLSESLNLEMIAQNVHLAPEYCCELFKKHTGKTIITYINEQRIDSAKRMFRLGNTSIRQVASQIGFCDAAYFSKVFSHITGMTPTDYCRSVRII